MKKALLVLVNLLLCLATLHAQDDYASERKAMVETQIKARGITHDATLTAMSSVLRHEFVPADMVLYAYGDRPLPIGQGQTISQPFIVAYMTQVLKPKEADRILEIGTGSGYQAAVLAKIVDSVYTIEIIEGLASEAEKRLKRLSYDNVVVRAGDGYHGWPEKAPFDGVIVTAGAEFIPEPLIDQLKIGGRMIIPVGPHRGIRQLVLVTKKKNKVVKKNLMAVRFVPFTRSKKRKD